MSTEAGKLVVREREAYTRVGLKRTSFRELVKMGQIPAPIKLTPRIRGYLVSDLDRWLNERIAASRPQCVHYENPCQEGLRHQGMR